MQLIERHVIRTSDPRYAAIDCAAFASKNLYNAANYLALQSFLHEGLYLGYAEVFHRIKHHEALPRKVSNAVLRLLDKIWKSYFAACKAYQEHPENFPGHPKLPKYKDKQKGRIVANGSNVGCSGHSSARSSMLMSMAVTT
ncbi:putative transposase [Thermosporothrix hazakensis]|jgi:putative transposase|uniref:Putative transposase n=1 Tax=Thermosporothrix hazakensis TaxID=644383 RepID=A0A326UCZ8_THEHA|nr:hypothetical protein [Thermosporothrix hazakensis]PZW26702.1 putative transposase [Thermosporothrix hazakensis]GCE47598.1 hypothetical protein KTH_24670 [Thermosporothrix hazakensis]